MKDSQPHANVIIRPPRLFLSVIVAALMINEIFPVESIILENYLIEWSIRMIGAVILLCGIIMARIAMYQFKSQATSVETWKSSTHLVVDGIYRVTRNPIYVAMFAMYFGLAIIIGNIWMLILFPVLFAVMQFGVVLREEIYLTDLFSDSYIEYKRNVRRWL